MTSIVDPNPFLFQLSDYEEIRIEWADLGNIKGLYLSTPTLKSPVIALAHSLHNNERELRCVLAHEFVETAGNHMIAASGLTNVYATKNEKAATRWAVNLMINTYAFLHCLKNGMDKLDLADYFFVLPEFIKLKRKYLRGSEEYEKVVAELNTSYSVYF